MNALQTAFGIVGGVITLAILLGAAYAAFRASDLRSTVSDQRHRIENLEGFLQDRDRELAEERSKRELLEGRLALVEERAGHLEEIVSGRIDFSALETHLESHHAEMVRRQDDRHDAVCTELKAVRAMLIDLKGMLEARRVLDKDGPV
jgi:chromosome segregation ATPase